MPSSPDVLRHIVLLTFKDSVPPAERAALLDAIRGLQAKVPSIRSLELGENLGPGRADPYTHVALVTFDDRDGLAAYASHPEHVLVSARIRDATARMLAVDLEG